MCLHVRIMKNILSLHCYHQPVIFQTPVPEVEIIWNTQQRIFKHTHTHTSQFLHRLVNRQPERKHFQGMREKLAAVTSLPKGRNTLAYSYSLCFTKIDASGSWCYFHLSVFSSWTELFFSLSTYCQNSRSKWKLLSNNWLSSPFPDVRWWVWLFLWLICAVWESFWPWSRQTKMDRWAICWVILILGLRPQFSAIPLRFTDFIYMNAYI